MSAMSDEAKITTMPETAAATAAQEASTEGVKPLVEMSNNELLAEADRLGIRFPTAVNTKAERVAYIEEHAGKQADTAAQEAPADVPRATVTEARDAEERPASPKQYRAKVMCFDGKLFKPGELRFSAKELDPRVWEEV